jgi:hypothetical protein
MRAVLLAGLLAAAAGPIFPQQEPPPAESEGLFLETLQEDIDTAGYYELLAWCRSLGLSDKGTRQVLQQRLSAHYGLQPTTAPPAATEGGKPKRLLEIKSARTSEYFTVKEAGDDLVVLEGDVVVELREEQAVHRIRARRVVLNQTQNLLMAEGGIEYTLVKGAEEERFQGERLTFDIDTWEGVFFGGTMEADRPVGGKTIRFRFHGDAISRLADDTVVLEKGTITSCDEPVDPHYSIRARKIWVLAPNEWAIAHAVLYIGRVPVLYLPFFFHPGDEFIFHPAIGYRDREGSFIQTTTYLIGQKKRQTSALSFLAAAEESGTQYAQEPHGLFLQPVKGKQPPPEGRFLKLLVDYYNRLGGFAGVQGEFPPGWSFRGGVALSRTVYQQYIPPYGTVWTPGFPSDWNEGWLLGLQVPFRFGLNGSWATASGPYRLAGRFEYFSDPFFTSDFFSRSEEVGLLRFMGMEDQTPTAEGQKGSLTWELSGQADFSESVKRPWLTRLSVPSFTTSLLWQSRTRSPAVSDYDPSRMFYYPASLRVPGISAQMEGTLLEVNRAARKGAQAPAGAGAVLKDWAQRLRMPGAYGGLPAGSAAKEAPPADTPAPALREPDPKADLPTLAARNPASLRLSYQLRPNVFVDQAFNATDWESPASVQYDIGYTSVDTSGVSSLGYDLRILESLLSLAGSLQYGLNYRSLYRQSLDEPSWESKVITSYAYNEMSLKSSTTLTYMPFLDDPVLGRSSLSYALGWTLLRYADDRPEASMVYGDPQYAPTAFRWDQRSVTVHQAKAAFVWTLDQWNGQFSLAAVLPVRPPSVTGNLQFEVWLLKTVLNTVYREEGAAWVWEPLVLQETLSLSDKARVSEELRFDLQEGLLEKSISSLTLGGFSGAFTAERVFPKTWNGTGWDAGTEKDFLPSYVNLGYLLAERRLYLWKNRVRLETVLSTAWSMNIQEFTQNSLDFSFTLRLFVHKFLEIAFTTVSYNNRTYRYFPALAEQIAPYEWVNPLSDLARSFNFFNLNDRYGSAFKLKSISLEAVHHLHDWDLSVRYDGKPVLRSDLVPKQYIWGNTVTILVEWAPLPEMRRSVKYDDTVPGAEPLSLRG